MAAFLCIELGNATRQSIQDTAQSLFCKVIQAPDANAAINAFAAEQDRSGRYVAIPAGALVSGIITHQKTQNLTPE